MSRFDQPDVCPECGNSMVKSELGNLCIHCGESTEVNEELWSLGSSSIVEWCNRFLELASRLQPFIDEVVEAQQSDANSADDVALFQIVASAPEPFADWEIPQVAQYLVPSPSQGIGDQHPESFVQYLAATVVSGMLRKSTTSSSLELDKRIAPSSDVVFEADWLEFNTTREVAESYVGNWRTLISELSDEHRDLAVRMMQGDASIASEPGLTFMEFVMKLSRHGRRR